MVTAAPRARHRGCGVRARAAAGRQLGDGDVLGVLARVLSIVAIALPLLGMGYIVGRLVRQVATGTWRRTEGRPVRRRLAAVVALALVAGLAWAWWPGGHLPPGPGVRGRHAARRGARGAGAGPTGLQEGRPGGGNSPLARRRRAADPEPPRAGPRDGPARRRGRPPTPPRRVGAAAPTWVFPFDRRCPRQRATTRRSRSTPRTARRLRRRLRPGLGRRRHRRQHQRGLRAGQLHGLPRSRSPSRWC